MGGRSCRWEVGGGRWEVEGSGFEREGGSRLLGQVALHGVRTLPLPLSLSLNLNLSLPSILSTLTYVVSTEDDDGWTMDHDVLPELVHGRILDDVARPVVLDASHLRVVCVCACVRAHV